MATHNKITQNEYDIIRNSDLSAVELSKILNRHRITIGNIAKKLGVKLKKHKIINEYELFFKTWSDDMAYVLGFIAADGCIMLTKRNGGRVEITLGIKDIEHLFKIKNIINCPQHIGTKTTNMNTQACRLTIGSRTMAENLIQLGITERKSLTLQWPNLIPDNYITHFIRGYIDGDGCLEIIQLKTKNNLRCSLLGTENFLRYIKDFFSENIYKKQIGSLYKTGNYYVLSYCGYESAKAFCDWIYNESSHKNRLDRKYLIYEKFIAQ